MSSFGWVSSANWPLSSRRWHWQKSINSASRLESCGVSKNRCLPGQLPFRRKCLSTPVHKYGNVFCYAATESADVSPSSFRMSAARSSFVNRQSKGVAIDS